MKAWVGRLHRFALASRSIPVVVRYLITISVVVLTSFLWERGGAYTEDRPFLTFIPIIFAAGAFLDRGNGCLATGLSALLIDYDMLAPTGSLAVGDPGDRIALALFVVVGAIISFVVETLHVGLVELATEHDRARLALKDRELLLEELSHRTRNDLANVITLLNLQARSADGAAKDALVSAADRVQTIARMHRRLEIYNNRVVVDTKSYIGDLCGDLRISRLASRPIALECEAESHAIALEKAVPIGLIVNESVTNATKHAFRDQRQGIISVRFVREGNVYKLTIADNGVGGGEAAATHEGGIGSRLMQMLAAQLGSEISIEPRTPGTAVVLTIAVKTAK
jgi:two-component sensor histidine kinase